MQCRKKREGKKNYIYIYIICKDIMAERGPNLTTVINLKI